MNFVPLCLFVALLQPRAVRHVFGKRGEHRPAFFTVRCGDDHSLRFKSAQLARLQIRYHYNLSTDEFFRFVVLSDPGQHLSWLFFSQIDLEQK